MYSKETEMLNNKKVSFALFGLTLSLGIVNVDAASRFTMRRFSGAVAPTTMQAVPVFGVCEALRFCHSSNPFQGKYVSLTDEGIIAITQPRYPIHKTSQNLMPPTRQTGPAEITLNPNGTYTAMIPTEPYPEGQILDPLPTETKLTGDAYEIITEGDATKRPHFSCGRLKMHFESLPSGKDYFCGSAAAIDKNLLVTAAHNFFPSHLPGRIPNLGKARANTVNFEHLLLGQDDRRGSYHIHVASHCYMHPEWEKSFNPHYDIALVFLSQCITLTKEENDELLKLQVLPASVTGSIRIVGYPETRPEMRASTGILGGGKDASQVIYHRANTHGGSSGSPIIKGGETIIGVHAYGTPGGATSPSDHNSGVRIRHDLLPFIEESVHLNQIFLEDEEKAMAEKAKVQERYEAKKAKKYIEKGEIEGKIDMVKNLIGMGLSDEQIITASKLSKEKIEEIRAGMKSDEQ